MKKQQFKKKLENYWYYHKVPTIAVILIFLTALYFLWTNTKQTAYDYQVALVTTDAISDTDCQKLQASLEACGADRNGDGEIHIELVPYIFQQGETVDPQRALAIQVQFIGDMEMGLSPLYIYSKEIYTLFKDEGFFPTDPSDLIPLKSASNQLPAAFDNMYISLFDYTRIDNNDNPKTRTYYQDCQSLLDIFRSSPN